MSTYIYFVRHAVSPYVFGNERARGLSEAGKMAALQVAEVLADEEINLIVSSSYSRAIETVKPLADQLNMPIIEFEELRERPIKGLNYQLTEPELLAGIEQSFIDIDYCLEGGETTREAQHRAVPILEKLLTDYAGQKIAIGTHGNILTILLKYYDTSYGYAFWQQTSQPDIYRLAFEDKQLTEVKRIWKP
ncbi:histidine phosphatase family protein [Paenibacillus psychroresistens]|uniref:Histidine phosphatase family protein n=1 Tax=Paenibacillus psychroresistens TaxID=1778678 RepID=A0A6B8RUJ4_9BACL|nr:histidine phosphatase family protein [Paenibacillus psychroresistens]QGQ99434.1 histidine phosphatase family protein [Paenibacillus psychroresistens]